MKPFRTGPREFSENDAVRVCCDVIRGGRGTYKEINARIAACSQAQQFEDLAEERAVQSAVDMLSLFQNMYLHSDDAMRRAAAALLLVVGILQIISLAGRFFPLLRLSSVAVQAALRNSEAIVIRLNNQRAANDAIFRNATDILRALTIRRAA